MNLSKVSAAAGLKAQQARIDMIANNVANVNTIGYKSGRLNFKDSMYAAGFSPGPARSPDGNQQKGHGVLICSISSNLTPGVIQRTDRDLDFAIEGRGFFELGDLNGNLFYTRNGNFNLSAEPDGTFLVNAAGLYVHDRDGNRIIVPPGTNAISVGEDGTIRFIGGEEETTSSIAVVMFRNITGLEAVGDSNFVETPASGEKFQSPYAVVRQGALEGSNVNLAQEMTRLIRTQRAFQLASRALTTADEMEGIANNMRR